ncbi:MAG: carboxypeptidase-like regulatory domain-containing protein [Mucilaginibacter sp.]|uniref:carboxypeptidase-like regulatory domain-containing protein n=1 Tax=Mucilaginibacter sp. TaxID=1882438 RepID=UPI00326334EF
MKLRSIITLAALFVIALSAKGQVLSGTVTEAGKNTRLENVFIRDIGSKQVALTDKSGEFDIRTSLNHTLIFSLPGYVSDTLFVVDLKTKHIELKQAGISLQAVNIADSKAVFNPEAEYPEIYRKSKFALSPSRMFGKESRDARRLKRYFKNEVEQRQIDAIFTRALVSSVVPLKGKELENFMAMYRPTLAFAKNSSQQTLVVYINDNYKKFKELPPDKRSLPALNSN